MASRFVSKRTCQRDDCTSPAIGVILITFYPLPGFMRYYNTTDPITTVLLDLAVCPVHAPEVIPADFFGGPIEDVIKTIERETGTTVDRDGIKTEVIPLDHPLARKIEGARKQRMR